MRIVSNKLVVVKEFWKKIGLLLKESTGKELRDPQDAMTTMLLQFEIDEARESRESGRMTLILNKHFATGESMNAVWSRRRRMPKSLRQCWIKKQKKLQFTAATFSLD